MVLTVREILPCVHVFFAGIYNKNRRNNYQSQCSHLEFIAIIEGREYFRVFHAVCRKIHVWQSIRRIVWSTDVSGYENKFDTLTNIVSVEFDSLSLEATHNSQKDNTVSSAILICTILKTDSYDENLKIHFSIKKKEMCCCVNDTQ